MAMGVGRAAMILKDKDGMPGSGAGLIFARCINPEASLMIMAPMPKKMCELAKQEKSIEILISELKNSQTPFLRLKGPGRRSNQKEKQ